MTPPIKPGVGAARAYTDQALGGPTTDQDSTFTVQTAVGIMLQANPDRVGVLFINNGANDVYIGLTSATAVNSGMKLPAAGGNFIANVRDDFTLPARTFYAIANGGTASVYILEIFRLQYTPSGEV